MVNITKFLQILFFLFFTAFSVSTYAGPVCGDGTIDDPNGETPPLIEECDEGVAAASDLCTNDTVQGNGRCTHTICGDGITQVSNGDPGFTGSEECDDGASNSDSTRDACRTNCIAASCGDNVVDTGEQCDDASLPTATCAADCTTIAAPACGDGNVDTGETCDDGNTTPADGCSATCQIEVCGNGTVDPGEFCDDGNTIAGDGCDASCQIETSAACGDGTVDAGETCDDGNTTPADGCSATCQIEVCGNGAVDPGEFCDDGNTTAGDGCDATCQLEIPAAVCGDGTVDEGEACDDGNTTAGDGCDASCQLETPVAVCGDGTVDAGEACDDGNTTAGDGCDASCQIETPAAVCGDGTVDAGEACDDGNTTAGDGCDASCQIEVDDTVTEPLPGGGGDVTIETATGQTLSDVSIVEATTGPSGVSFPLGVISYTTTVPSPGDSATVRLTFPTNLPADLVLYKVDTGGVFTELPTSLWTQVNATTVDITLTDGGLYDLDNMVNGVIVDPIAPGGLDSSNNSFIDSENDGFFGCTLSTSTTSKDPTLPLLLLLSVSFLYRRRDRG